MKPFITAKVFNGVPKWQKFAKSAHTAAISFRIFFSICPWMRPTVVASFLTKGIGPTKKNAEAMRTLPRMDTIVWTRTLSQI